jgi:uncharacterized protein YdeI (YjbR/CyaY-like superfamily)
VTDIPPELGRALAAAGLTQFFAACTGAHRREYLKWIAEAKQPDTRSARIEKTVQQLAAKRAEERQAGGAGKARGARD